MASGNNIFHHGAIRRKHFSELVVDQSDDVLDGKYIVRLCVYFTGLNAVEKNYIKHYLFHLTARKPIS
jgi:hypothetical protein